MIYLALAALIFQTAPANAASSADQPGIVVGSFPSLEAHIAVDRIMVVHDNLSLCTLGANVYTAFNRPPSLTPADVAALKLFIHSEIERKSDTGVSPARASQLELFIHSRNEGKYRRAESLLSSRGASHILHASQRTTEIKQAPEVFESLRIYMRAIDTLKPEELQNVLNQYFDFHPLLAGTPVPTDNGHELRKFVPINRAAQTVHYLGFYGFDTSGAAKIRFAPDPSHPRHGEFFITRHDSLHQQQIERRMSRQEIEDLSMAFKVLQRYGNPILIAQVANKAAREAESRFIADMLRQINIALQKPSHSSRG